MVASLVSRGIDMTVCVAALCDMGRALVVVSDKMIGLGFVQGEGENWKGQVLHPQWLLMMAGGDIAPLFEIGDLVRAELRPDEKATLEEVSESVQRNYELTRARQAEAMYLKPIGWTIERFNREGPAVLPNFLELQAHIGEHELAVEILVAGFDHSKIPPGRIFTLSPPDRGMPRRHDLPGFAAIGSGAIAAEYMLHFKEYSPSWPIRAAVYYVLEAKYFGEYATGVGEQTDLLVFQFDGNATRVIRVDDAKTIEPKLIPLCQLLEPMHLLPEDIDILNSLPELKGLPELPRTNKYNKQKAKEMRKRKWT
jgi:hypothetical protein